MVSRVTQQHEYESTTITRLHNRIKQLENERAQLVKAVGLIDRCIQIISANGISKIESIVSHGLQLVFDDPEMCFLVDKKETARGISYRLMVRQDEVCGNPMDNFGGSVQNVVGLLLRVVLIRRFKLAKFMVLDESFSNVGNQKEFTYLVSTSNLLRRLCDDYGFNILAISHQPILTSHAHSIYRVSVNADKLPTLKKVEGAELEELQTGGAFEGHQA
jgi:hypothetical protein